MIILVLVAYVQLFTLCFVLYHRDKKPWEIEPDFVQWRDKASGYVCRALRGPMDAWCGYVRVPEGHLFHGVHYNQYLTLPPLLHRQLLNRPFPIELLGVVTLFCADTDAIGEGRLSPALTLEVHGGLTYSDGDAQGWWLGFDCAHAGDLMPAMMRIYEEIPEMAALSWLHDHDVYRDLAYVREHCRQLANQLKALEAWHVESRNAAGRSDQLEPIRVPRFSAVG